MTACPCGEAFVRYASRSFRDLCSHVSQAQHPRCDGLSDVKSIPLSRNFDGSRACTSLRHVCSLPLSSAGSAGSDRADSTAMNVCSDHKRLGIASKCANSNAKLWLEMVATRRSSAASLQQAPRQRSPNTQARKRAKTEATSEVIAVVQQELTSEDASSPQVRERAADILLTSDRPQAAARQIKKKVKSSRHQPSIAAENVPNLQAKAARIYDQLMKMFVDPPCPLDHQSPFQLLVSVILSAQVKIPTATQQHPIRTRSAVRSGPCANFASLIAISVSTSDSKVDDSMSCSSRQLIKRSTRSLQSCSDWGQLQRGCHSLRWS